MYLREITVTEFDEGIGEYFFNVIGLLKLCFSISVKVAEQVVAVTH